MGELFKNLCKGPVVVIDDEITNPLSKISKLVEKIELENLPVIKYDNLKKAREQLDGLIFSNFVILDWIFNSISDTGETIPESNEENIEFIEALQKVCIAPIFVISNEPDGAENVLRKKKILKGKNDSVFVKGKSELFDPPDVLIKTIEKWIEDNPHVYLAKWWTNEWLKKNTSVFWDLYHSAPNWPNLVYKTLKNDGDEPALGLIEILSQLVYSEISASSLNESPIGVNVELDDLQSLKNLYKRLVYTTNDIGSDIKPGDVFKIKGDYYLNIRPECDTTKRGLAEAPDLYLIKGEKYSSKKVKEEIQFDPKYGIIQREYQIVMFFLDGKDVVVFNKNELRIMKYTDEIREKKLCRVVHPYITKIRQSFISYIGRFGTPAYPKEILKEIFAPDT